MANKSNPSQGDKPKTVKPKKTSQEEKNIQAKNDKLLINNTTKDIGKVMNEESRRRKRKKQTWLILLLLLLLLVVIGTSILAYFLITNNRKPSNIALEVNVSGYLVDEVDSENNKLISSGHYAYKEGEENNQNKKLKCETQITATTHLRIDYAVSNLSNIAYSYVILVHLDQNINCSVKYYLGTEENDLLDVPEDGAIRVSSESNFSVSVVIDIVDTTQEAELSGNIIFTVII